MVNDETKYNVAPRHISLSLKDRDESNLTIITYIYKNKMYQSTLRGPRT